MRFSVLLPTRNRLDYLRDAVESVRRQDFADWELIVSDNDSAEDIRGFIDGLGDPRIRYFRTDSFVPVTDNWNNALVRSSGDVVIMLGDDDCLMSGYFTALNRAMETHPDPDFIYTGAYLFAYPGVMPGHPEGFLQPYSYGSFLQGATSPFWLDRPRAHRLVAAFMSFRTEYGYNMQFFAVSRRMIRRLEAHGQFFQSPFPDYYAANAMMLAAERILVLPRPLVTIGITPKSFGFYFLNNREEEGAGFLKDIPDPEVARAMRAALLPGSHLFTSWLFSAEILRLRFGGEFPLTVDLARYRRLQTRWIYRGRWVEGTVGGDGVEALWERLSVGERLALALPLAVLYRLRAWTPSWARRLLAATFRRLPGRRAPASPTLHRGFKTIREVFTQVDPAVGLPALPGQRPRP